MTHALASQASANVLPIRERALYTERGVGPAAVQNRLIPLSQVHQYLGLDPSCRVPVAVLRRRGCRRTVATPLRGLSRPIMSWNSFMDRALATQSPVAPPGSYLTISSVTWDNGISLVRNGSCKEQSNRPIHTRQAR